MLLQADMKVSEEWKKLLFRGKTKDTLAAYYTNFIIEMAKKQSKKNKQSSSMVNWRTE